LAFGAFLTGALAAGLAAGFLVAINISFMCIYSIFYINK
jgi:hypothetical protein